jgi:hypothetical protein
MDAPRSAVFKALSDYDRFTEFSSRHEESRFIEPAADGTPRIYTKVRGCVWFFCRKVERYAHLSLEPETRIVATAEPENSDVEYGVEVWEFEVVGEHGLQTRVLYSHEAKPRFWVPPVIGIWAIKRTLKKDALSATQSIEDMALNDALSTESND